MALSLLVGLMDLSAAVGTLQRLRAPLSFDSALPGALDVNGIHRCFAEVAGDLAKNVDLWARPKAFISPEAFLERLRATDRGVTDRSGVHTFGSHIVTADSGINSAEVSGIMPTYIHTFTVVRIRSKYGVEWAVHASG